MIGSDKREMAINGDIDTYDNDPFEYEPDGSENNNLLSQLSDTALLDKGDHIEILDFNILKFDVF